MVRALRVRPCRARRDVNGGPSSGGNIVEKRVNNDLDPRLDYGLGNTDNRHAFTSGANWDAWRGLGIGATFRYYSGNPVNETLGRDANLDGIARSQGRVVGSPGRGRDDATLPIVSPVDANGLAIRNGIDGVNKVLLDVRLQYEFRMAAAQSLGFYWEIYNALNRVNFGNPVGDRRSPTSCSRSRPTCRGRCSSVPLHVLRLRSPDFGLRGPGGFRLRPEATASRTSL